MHVINFRLCESWFLLGPRKARKAQDPVSEPLADQPFVCASVVLAVSHPCRCVPDPHGKRCLYREPHCDRLHFCSHVSFCSRKRVGCPISGRRCTDSCFRTCCSLCWARSCLITKTALPHHFEICKQLQHVLCCVDRCSVGGSWDYTQNDSTGPTALATSLISTQRRLRN